MLDREIVEPKIYEYDIQWVITIPAIWNPQSKEFMRAAAEEVGFGLLKYKIHVYLKMLEN